MKLISEIAKQNRLKGQGLAEYTMIAGLVAVVGIAAFTTFGETVSNQFGAIGANLDNAFNPSSSNPSSPATQNPSAQDPSVIANNGEPASPAMPSTGSNPPPSGQEDTGNVLPDTSTLPPVNVPSTGNGGNGSSSQGEPAAGVPAVATNDQAITIPQQAVPVISTVPPVSAPTSPPAQTPSTNPLPVTPPSSTTPTPVAAVPPFSSNPPGTAPTIYADGSAGLGCNASAGCGGTRTNNYGW